MPNQKYIVYGVSDAPNMRYLRGAEKWLFTSPHPFAVQFGIKMNPWNFYSFPIEVEFTKIWFFQVQLKILVFIWRKWTTNHLLSKPVGDTPYSGGVYTLSWRKYNGPLIEEKTFSWQSSRSEYYILGLCKYTICIVKQLLRIIFTTKTITRNYQITKE